MEQNDVVSLTENRALTPDEVGLLAGLIADEPDHYTVLGVDRNASSDVIQKAYCLAVEFFHPLKSRKITDSDSVMHWRLSSAFLRIEEAFTVLSSPARREVYDDNLLAATCRSTRRRSNQRRSSTRTPADNRSQRSTDASGANEVRPAERRRVQRVPLNLPVKVTFDRHRQERGETLDVSPLGVRFRLSRDLEPGSELRLELPMPKNLRTHSYDEDLYVASAYVIYSSGSNAGWQIVAEFI